jgi:glycosyltransferase involved in cell wall biosynthesis
LSHLAIIIPIFNDWQSAEHLLSKVVSLKLPETTRTTIVLVDDGSTDTPDFNKFTARFKDGLTKSIVIRLNHNVGHQTAISVGLTYISQKLEANLVIVMDGDGEDNPTDILRLLEASRSNPGSIVVANRSERSESLFFRCAYSIYQFVFFLVTGQQISFGNFTLLPMNAVFVLINMPEMWLSYPASVLRSKMRIVGIPTRRTQRYFGKSQLALTGLVLHGLCAISAFSDRVAARLIIASIGFGTISIASVLVAFIIKFFTGLATPGWATTLVFGFSTITLLLGMVCINILFSVLNQRTTIQVRPRTIYKEYIADVVGL